MPLSIRIDPAVGDEEAAAAVAAIVLLLESEAPVQGQLRRPGSRWSGAARLLAQGIALAPTLAPPGWGSVERLRRAGRGGTGIVGL